MTALFMGVGPHMRIITSSAGAGQWSLIICAVTKPTPCVQPSGGYVPIAKAKRLDTKRTETSEGIGITCFGGERIVITLLRT